MVEMDFLLINQGIFGYYISIFSFLSTVWSSKLAALAQALSTLGSPSAQSNSPELHNSPEHPEHPEHPEQDLLP